MEISQKQASNPLEKRGAGILLNAILFVTNFLLFYFIFMAIFQDLTGLLRLGLCWVGAYSLTWFMASQAKGTARLVLTMVFVAILYIVFRYHP